MLAFQPPSSWPNTRRAPLAFTLASVALRKRTLSNTTWSNRAPVRSASMKPMPSPLVRVQTVFTSFVPRKQTPDKSAAPTFCRDRSPPSITIICPTGAALRRAAIAANVRNFRPSIAAGKTEPVPSTSPAPKRQLRATGGAVLGAGMITTLVGEPREPSKRLLKLTTFQFPHDNLQSKLHSLGRCRALSFLRTWLKIINVAHPIYVLMAVNSDSFTIAMP